MLSFFIFYSAPLYKVFPQQGCGFSLSRAHTQQTLSLSLFLSLSHTHTHTHTHTYTHTCTHTHTHICYAIHSHGIWAVWAMHVGNMSNRDCPLSSGSAISSSVEIQQIRIYRNLFVSCLVLQCLLNVGTVTCTSA